MRLDVADRKQTLNFSARAVMNQHALYAAKDPKRHVSPDAFHCGCKYGRVLRALLVMHREGAA